MSGSPRPIGVFDSGVGGLTVLREIIRRSPDESTIYLGDNARAPYGVRTDDEVLGLLERSASTRSPSATSRRSSSPATPRPRSPSPRSAGATTCRSWASSGPGASAAALATRNRRVGVIATPATIRSHAYFEAIKDENPAVEVYEHATPALVPLVEAGDAARPGRGGDGRATALAPLLGERDADRRVHLPAAARRAIDTLLLGCTHYPLLRPLIEAVVGPRVAIVIRPPRPPRRSPSCSGSTGSEAAGRGAQPTHLQLTTGDAARFAELAGRLFGADFPDVVRLDLAVAAR